MADYLVIPTVFGPVSTASRYLRVQGHVPGATVVVIGIDWATERIVAEAIPDAPGDGVIPILASVILGAGERLYAIQRTSKASSDTKAVWKPEIVLGPPVGALGGLAIQTKSYECGGCIYVEGTYPGAAVFLADGLSRVRGASSAIGTFARFSFAPTLTIGESLSVWQAVSAATSPRVPWGPAAPPPLDPLGKPPEPSIRSQVTECTSSVLIEGIVAGAVVELERRRNQVLASDTSCIEFDAVWWPTSDLKEGDSLRARQILCEERRSYWSEIVPVERGRLKAPVVVAPCGAETAVRVNGIEPGALVTITVRRFGKEDTFTGQASAASWTFQLSTKRIAEGSELFATQTTCGQTVRGPSVRARSAVFTRPKDPEPVLPTPAPRIVGPLNACATRVRVADVPIGAYVSIISQNYALASVVGSGSIGPEVYVSGPKHYVDVPVIALQGNDQLWAVARVCGTLYSSEPATPVGHLIDIPNVELLPVTTCGPIVVHNITPGAVLELYVNGVLVPPMLPIPVATHVFAQPKGLAVGDRVKVREQICGEQRESLERTVTAPTGPMVLARDTVRLQQLTGNVDPDPVYPGLPPRKRPTPNFTFRDYDLPGMDLGVPVEHMGELYIFFGDSRTHAHGPRDVSAEANGPFIRPIARVVDAPDDPSKGIVLDFLQNPNGSARSLRVDDPTNPFPRTSDEAFFVPSGGFSWDGKIYLFVMQAAAQFGWITELVTGELWQNDKYGLTFDTSAFDIVGGRSLMCVSEHPSDTFLATPIVDIRSFSLDDSHEAWKFVQVCPLVAEGDDIPELGVTGQVLLLWGTGAYRQSDVCFAWAPLESGRNAPGPSEWNFFVGGAAPARFSRNMRQAVGLLVDPGPNASPKTSYFKTERNGRPLTGLGEFSVAYIREVRRWLMLITPATFDTTTMEWVSHVSAFTAAHPWGPWEPVATGPVPGIELLDVRALPRDIIAKTGIYGPYLISRLTEWQSESNTLRIVFIASFLDGKDGPEEHGQVHMYEAHLRCDT